MKVKTKKLLGVFATWWRAKETCAACREKFVCGVTLAECWCSEVKLSETARAELKMRYKSCLCRKCLERFAAKA